MDFGDFLFFDRILASDTKIANTGSQNSQNTQSNSINLTMSMIRYGLYNLSTRLPPLTTALATTVARPAAVVLAGKVNPAWFSTNPKRRDDDLMDKTYSDAFDESDSLEVGKEEHLKVRSQTTDETCFLFGTTPSSWVAALTLPRSALSSDASRI